MNVLETGLPTLHTRAESWECDFNGHWNARYYCRSFQSALEVALALGGCAGDGGRLIPARHVRFHSELFAGDAAEVRSFLVPEMGVAHYLSCEGRVAATSLDAFLSDPQGAALRHLPVLSPEDARQALPRSLTGDFTPPWEPDPQIDQICELGPVRDEDVDERGTLGFKARVARLASGSHHHAASLGLTSAYTRDHGVGRMLVEMRHRPLGTCRAGEMLRLASRLIEVSRKSWLSAHLLLTHSGTPVAVFEQCLVAVNLKARRATSVPDFIVQAAPRRAGGSWA